MNVDEKVGNLQSYLNSKVPEYLGLIYQEYGSYMNQEQIAFLKKLMTTENVVVETNGKKYLENQIQEIEQSQELTLQEKEKLKNKLTIPLAHGGKVFKDQKIHFYPFILKEQSDLEKKCEGILIHELFHFFINPKYMNVSNNETLSNMNSYVIEGLVDMCTRDLMRKNNILHEYTSDYGSNVIFIRTFLQNIPSYEERMSLVFQGNIQKIIERTSNKEEFYQKFMDAKNKNTSFDSLIKELAIVCDENHIESGVRFLNNISANAKNKEEALQTIKTAGSYTFPDKQESINNLIDNYRKSIQNESEDQEFRKHQQERDNERQMLKKQMETLINSEGNSMQQNVLDEGMVRELISNNFNTRNGKHRGFANIIMLSLITSGFILLIVLLTSFFIK